MSNGETIERGQVWWANLGRPAGSEPGFRRPVLVIQADPFNHSRINTTIVAAITSSLRLADAPGNVALGQGAGGLPKASVVNVSQLATIEKSRLDSRSGDLPRATMDRIDAGIRLVLDV